MHEKRNGTDGEQTKGKNEGEASKYESGRGLGKLWHILRRASLWSILQVGGDKGRRRELSRVGDEVDTASEGGGLGSKESVQLSRRERHNTLLTSRLLFLVLVGVEVLLVDFLVLVAKVPCSHQFEAPQLPGFDPGPFLVPFPLDVVPPKVFPKGEAVDGGDRPLLPIYGLGTESVSWADHATKERVAKPYSTSHHHPS